MAIQKKKPAAKEQQSSGKSKTEAKEQSGGMSKASAFDAAKATGAVDAGKYEAVIREFVLQKPDEKGQSARIKYLIASEGDAQGETLSQWYKLFETDESPAKGLAFLKKDLAILGYADVRFKELENVFEEIVEKKMAVVITVKHNEGFINAYMQGLCEDSEVVAEFLENNPY